MFAVLKTGGKQYKVASGDILRVEKVTGNAGDTVQFNDIMMVGGEGDTVIGAPMVADAGVQAEILEQGKGPKLINFVKRRRKHSSQRTKGHRQQITVLRVTTILAKGAGKSGVAAALNGAGFVAAATEAAAKPAKKAAAPKAEKKPAAPKAEKKAAAPKAEKKAAPKADAASEENSGTKPANLLTEARDGKPDDLKLISGVGPKLEGVLHANGVFHFDQVAAWNSEEIAYMDDQLSFKGRIERDEWLKQAAELMKG